MMDENSNGTNSKRSSSNMSSPSLPTETNLSDSACSSGEVKRKRSSSEALFSKLLKTDVEAAKPPDLAEPDTKMEDTSLEDTCVSDDMDDEEIASTSDQVCFDTSLCTYFRSGML